MDAKRTFYQCSIKTALISIGEKISTPTGTGFLTCTNEACEHENSNERCGYSRRRRRRSFISLSTRALGDERTDALPAIATALEDGSATSRRERFARIPTALQSLRDFGRSNAQVRCRPSMARSLHRAAA
jgi:hypothetical protein